MATLPRGGVSGWISDDVLLVSGRESLQAREQTLSALSLVNGSVTQAGAGGAAARTGAIAQRPVDSLLHHI